MHNRDDVYATALRFHATGASVVPVKLDGTKAIALGTWKQYQNEPAGPDQLQHWFGSGHPALGLVCGAVSGHLELFELEGRAVAEGLRERLAALLTHHGLAELWARITGGYLEHTPSGGLHILYRLSDGPVGGNTKLAQRPATPAELTEWKSRRQAQINDETDAEKRAKQQRALDNITRGEQIPQVLAETRGEGGFVVIAPTTGAAHESGRGWTMEVGGPDTIATITADERDRLHAVARMLDQMPAPVVRPDPEPRLRAVTPAGELAPGEHYNQTADWADILEPHGWRELFRRGDTIHWTRPGKNDGTSATTGYGDQGDYLYVFTSSTELPSEEALSKFAAYTHLEHGGNYTDAARELRRQGYGGEPPARDRAAEQRAAFAELLGGGTDGNLAYDQAVEQAKQRHVEPVPDPAPEPARIDVSSEPKAITGVTEALAAGAIPDLYVRNGQLVRIDEISGALAEDRIGPAIGIQTIDADHLRRLLAFHTETYRWKAVPKNKQAEQGEFVAVETSPTAGALNSVLSATRWPTLQALAGVVAAPVLRPDGTLLQDAGYDEATGLYYDPALTIPPVADRPTEAEVAAARQHVLGLVLGDFPWKDDADRANYVALLVTPILRSYIGGLTPLGAISANERGSGKTLLTNIIGQLYGMTSRPWVSNNDELRKAITAVLLDTAPTVLFDNVGEHDAVSAPSLAKLLTSRRWDDRLLGANSTVQAVNDRLWLVTGNSIEFGGDIAQRTVLVRLDAKTPRPDLRTGFQIGDLEGWLEDDANRAGLLSALLVLARSWIVAGAPREEFVMRGFSRWASGLGGFLKYHGLTGFLANTAELEEHDEEASAWAAFLATWYRKYGNDPVTAVDLRRSADHEYNFSDPWQGTFITRADGTLPNPRGLGMMLNRRRGRFFGKYSLQGELDSHEKVWRWAAVPYEPAEVPQ